MNTDIDEFQLLIEENLKSKQEQALILLSIVDYYLLKSAQTENDSDRQKNWDNASEIRSALTGEKLIQTRNTLGGDEMTVEQIVAYQQSGLTFAEFIKNLT